MQIQIESQDPLRQYPTHVKRVREIRRELSLLWNVSMGEASERLSEYSGYWLDGEEPPFCISNPYEQRLLDEAKRIVQFLWSATVETLLVERLLTSLRGGDSLSDWVCRLSGCASDASYN